MMTRFVKITTHGINTRSEGFVYVNPDAISCVSRDEKGGCILSFINEEDSTVHSPKDINEIVLKLQGG
jgi:hypothetical protein